MCGCLFQHYFSNFLIQAVHSCLCLVAESCLTLCDPMDCSPPSSSVVGIIQLRTLEWVAISFSRVSSQPRNQTGVFCIAGGFFSSWAIRVAPIQAECPTIQFWHYLPGVDSTFKKLRAHSHKIAPTSNAKVPGCHWYLQQGYNLGTVKWNSCKE